MDASHEKFRGLFMNTLKEQLAKVGRSIDYILVSHTEPDHSGAPGHGSYCVLPGSASWMGEPQQTSLLPICSARQRSSPLAIPVAAMSIICQAHAWVYCLW